jgi:acetylornithine aminotransferase
MTLAKGLGNGFPIGACLARGPAADVLQPGSHGSTFGGNPVACAAAMATLDVFEEDKLLRRAADLGDSMTRALREQLADTPGVQDVRNKGLMIAVELDRACGELVAQGIDAGLLINVTADKVVRLLPPLVLSDEDAQHLVKGDVGLIKTFSETALAATS